MAEQGNSWGAFGVFEAGASWEDVLTGTERAGGPSPHGSSWWKDFRTCEYLFWAKHVRGMEAASTHPRFEKLHEALELGGLYHEALARYYLEHLKHFDGQGMAISDASQEEVDEACILAMYDIVNRAEKVVPGTATQVRRYLEGWLQLFGPGRPLDDRRSTMYVEQMVEVDADGFPYSTRWDRVFWDAKLGGPVLQEHKTASFYSEALLASYRTDPQMIGQMYCWERSEFAKRHGPLVGYRVSICVKKAQREYPQEDVPVNGKVIKDWVKDQRWLYMQMQQCAALKTWPRRRGNCIQWMRPCEFHEHCSLCSRNWYGYSKKR